VSRATEGTEPGARWAGLAIEESERELDGSRDDDRDRRATHTEWVTHAVEERP
jgi:hypothetical protein